MSLRRRRFDPTPDDDYNPTNYDEKYVIPTGVGAELQQQQSMFGSAPDYTAPVYKNEQPLGFGAAAAPAAAGVGSDAVKATAAEQPMVFALRSDAQLYVYEYSDRLEYYRNTPGGMLLCNIENKRK